MGVYVLGEVIAFLSGKGGTGKSALCAAVATALAKDGRRVLCIDTDAPLRALDVYLGLSGADALSFADVCRGDYPLSGATVHPRYPTLSFLTAPLRRAEDVCAPEFAAMLTRERTNFDFILLDGPSGLGENALHVAACADRRILVTLPDPASIRSVERTAQELETAGISEVRLIVNRVYRDQLKAMHMDIDDVMDAVGLPLLGVVPTDPNIGFAAAAAQPLIAFSRFGAASAACKRIAKRLQGQSVPVVTR